MSDSSRWVAALAARLRLLQSSFADELPETREKVLAEELEQALKTVTLGKRKECIEALAHEFPVPEPVETARESAPAAEPAELPDDPAALVDRLLSLVQTMTPEEIAAISLRLQNSALAPAGRTRSIEVPEELREHLKKLAPGRSLDETRALRILDVLIEFALNLDQLVWEVWKNVAAKSVIQREPGSSGNLRKAVALYLTGDPEVSSDQIKQIIGKTRKLVSGLMAAMGTVGEIRSVKVLERLSPESIRKSAEADPGVFESIEKKCWRKYHAAFSELTGPIMEREILDAVKKYTEKLVLGPEVAETLEE